MEVKLEFMMGDTLFELGCVVAAEDIVDLEETSIKSDTRQGLQQELKENSKEQEESTELLVIGGGPGGYEAAIHAAILGMKVILVEAHALGGTCLNEGCIPTKALNKAAKTYCESIHASKMGININYPEIDMSRMTDWKDEVKETLVRGIHGLLKHHQVKLIKGIASFESDKIVMVSGNDINIRISAEKIIIATGAVSAGLNIPGMDIPQVITSKEALELKELPAAVTIIGGGVIGMEFAFILKSLGTKVQVIEYMDSILPMLDEDISLKITTIAANTGIVIQTGAKVKGIEEGLGKEAIIRYEKDGKEGLAVSEKVLMAVGRVPNHADLNLEAAGIQLSNAGKGIPVNSYMQTNISHIYGIGDVNNIMQLAHVAFHQGILAVNHMNNMKAIPMALQLVPNVIFTIPEIASVGKTEKKCREEGISYELYKFPFNGNGKALILGDTEGFVKLIKNSMTDEIIGGAVIGPDASVLINSITELVQFKIKAGEASEMIFPHPTTGEAIFESVLGLEDRVIHSVNKKEVKKL